MKRTLMAFAAAVTTMLVPVATVQAQSTVAVYQIPFNFTAEGVTLASGKYTMQHDVAKQFQNLRSARGSGIFLPAGPQLSGTTGAKLVFHKYGERYFLAQVWDTNGTGRNMPVSKEERELTRNPSMAKASFEQITLLAQR
ncbi:MAG: hypothetical protein JO061_21515 [Acidobacteriaceae bacterium]|nr:hypothetical protein [Acidobacteriaceae bacterium]